jgi:hypothetical protein
MKDERLIKTLNRPTSQDTRASARPERVPISGIKNIIGVSGIRGGFHACWVNEPNVPAYQAAGYTFVENDVSFGSHHVQQANPLGARYARNMGLGTIAYLMEIPQEYYDSDRDLEAKEVDDIEASMKREARSLGLDHGDIALSRGRIE